MKRTYKSTRRACYVGYLVQAVVNNLSPVFFVIYQREYGVSYSLLSCLIIMNFITQLIVDILCIHFVNKFGQRRCVVAAHIINACGLVMLGVLPSVMPVPFAGLVIATVFCAVGSGIIEVIISPVVSALPSDNKTGDMSLLHSFYCWGQLIVVLSTTLLLALGVSWRIICLLWAVLPVVNTFNFLTVPIVETEEEETAGGFSLFKSGMFICFAVLMMSAGASELALSQWASLFIETSLKIPKAMGDIMGPCMFALFMGMGRVLFGLYGEKLKVNRVLFVCAAACFVSYIMASMSEVPFMSLIACALCGFSVSVMWPGVLSSAAHTHFGGSTALFALLALFGDSGCTAGPALAGFLSDIAENSAKIGMSGLRFGLLGASVFPVIMMVTLGVISLKGKTGE